MAVLFFYCSIGHVFLGRQQKFYGIFIRLPRSISVVISKSSLSSENLVVGVNIIIAVAIDKTIATTIITRLEEENIK